MKNSFSIRYYARACKCTKNGECPLELCVNVNGTRKFINLPFKTTPEAFHRKRQPKELVDYMALMRTRVDEILTDMLRSGEPLTTEALVGYLRNGGYKSYTVGDLFNEFLSLTEERVGKTLTKASLRKYELVRALFFEIADSSKECTTQLTHGNVLKFKVKCESRYEQATSAGYLRRLKTIVNYALDNGKITINPFQGIKIKRGEKPIVYLKQWEQEALINAKVDNESLARVRDCAVLQLATGLSYADLHDFKKSDVQERNGVYYIEKRRHKTGKPFCSVILKPGIDVLNRYEGELKIATNQKYNLYLKTLQDLLGIQTPLTTHVFRRSFATNLLNAGVRLETVASACGHGVAICKKYYAQMQNETVIKEISTKVG